MHHAVFLVSNDLMMSRLSSSQDETNNILPHHHLPIPIPLGSDHTTSFRPSIHPSGTASFILPRLWTIPALWIVIKRSTDTPGSRTDLFTSGTDRHEPMGRFHYFVGTGKANETETVATISDRVAVSNENENREC